jgi:hypothetical protein
MPLFNIFSNIWFYFPSQKIEIKTQKNKYAEEKSLIMKISKTHHIDKILYLDDEFQFWYNSNFDSYNPAILQQIEVNNQQELTNRFNKFIKIILKYLVITEESIIFTTIQNPEILIAFYIYMLSKVCNLGLNKAITTYNGKIQGINYSLDNRLNNYLILNCYN